MNGRPRTSGRGRPAALVLPRRCRRGTLPTPRRSHWPSACHPLALPVAIISPVAPRTATCGPPAGRTTSPGAWPYRPRGRVVAWAPSAFIAPPAAGWLARGSSCRPPGRRVVLRRSAGAAQVVAGAGFRLAVGGECCPGGQVGVCGGEVICSWMPAQAAGTAGPAGSWPISAVLWSSPSRRACGGAL
jgi:hypothetical protein